MSEKLSASERIAGQVLNYGNSGWYFIASGSNPEELLQNEEELRLALEKEIANGNLGSYMAVSSFFPSQRTQRLSYRAAEKLLPLADAQFENLGFPLTSAEEYRKEFVLSAEQFLIPAENTFPMELAANLKIGKTEKKYYSCMLPLHAADEGVFRKIAGEMENVFFINKAKDIGEELDRLTRIMLLLFLAAFVVIAAVVRRFYTWKQTFRICAVPVFLILAVLSVLSLLDIPLGFFSAAGLLLVFGLGLDYIFYSTEAGKKDGARPLTALAILLSFATTVLSFGALALSSFAPVHIFGVTVLSGLCAAYIFSTLLSVKVVSENQRNSGAVPEK
jgi:predicted exporter